MTTITHEMCKAFMDCLIERIAKVMCNTFDEKNRTEKFVQLCIFDNPTFDYENLPDEGKMFINKTLTHISRTGVIELLMWLINDTDFFTAPCSTRYHLSVPGGLVKHSLNVFEILERLRDTFFNVEVDMESVAIVSLFHDICKVNTYKPCKKSRKTGKLLPNGKPVWEDYDGYDFDEDFPYGHGEKSVYLIQKFMTIGDEEAMAIRWHMGYSDSSFKGGSQSVSNAMQKYPLIAFLHSADMISTAIEGHRELKK